MTIQINGAAEKIIKKIAVKKKTPPFELMLNLLLREHREVFNQEYKL
mgnify:FL=1